MTMETFDAASVRALLATAIDAPGTAKPSTSTLAKLFKMLKQTKVCI